MDTKNLDLGLLDARSPSGGRKRYACRPALEPEPTYLVGKAGAASRWTRRSRPAARPNVIRPPLGWVSPLRS